VLHGDEARRVDLDVTDKIGRIRILESVATRIADTIHYHLGLIPPSSPSEDTAPLLFVAGKGNNGANAIACARILHMRAVFGQKIRLVTLVDDEDGSILRPNMSAQLELFDALVGRDKRMAINKGGEALIREWKGVIVEGVLGTGISDPPRGLSLTAITACNVASAEGGARILAIDLPSGLNHVTGEAPGECIRATWTLNLHMLKEGQLEETAVPYVGELWSAETALGFNTFGDDLTPKFVAFYKDGPIQRVW